MADAIVRPGQPGAPDMRRIIRDVAPRREAIGASLGRYSIADPTSRRLDRRYNDRA